MPLDVGQHSQALLHAGTAKRRVRASVGLVVRRLEDERNLEVRADGLQFTRDVDLQLPRFDDARSCDQEERAIEADVVAAELHVDRPGPNRRQPIRRTFLPSRRDCGACDPMPRG